MTTKRVFLGLDIGAKRIGVAVGDSIGRLASPVATLDVATAPDALRRLVAEHDVSDIVIGLPRNQSGEITAQTQWVQNYAQEHVAPLGLPMEWQDESVTSVLAEDNLKMAKKSYTKADIDAEAACLILQDYLERLSYA